MVDEEQFDDGEERERSIEEVAVTETATFQRIIAPRSWGRASLLGTAERGALLLYGFAGMPHFLCWRLPDDEDIVVEVVSSNAGALPEGGDPNVATWVLPDDIDEERVRYPARWGRPTALVDAWLDGGPLLLVFEDEEHVVRWELAEDMLLSLVADDSL